MPRRRQGAARAAGDASLLPPTGKILPLAGNDDAADDTTGVGATTPQYRRHPRPSPATGLAPKPAATRTAAQDAAEPEDGEARASDADSSDTGASEAATTVQIQPDPALAAMAAMVAPAAVPNAAVQNAAKAADAAQAAAPPAR
jgi:hypothetical protein